MSQSLGGRTPPHIKWLLNERAMLQGELRQLSIRLPALQKHVVAAELALAQASAKLLACQQAHDRAQSQVRALTTSIESFVPEIRPDAVEPVNAWAGKYGQRGALTDFLKDELKSRFPEVISLQALCLAAQKTLGVVHQTPRERESFRFTVRAILRRLRSAGLVELPPTTPTSRRTSLWKWRGETTSFGQLREQEAQREQTLAGNQVAAQ